jgi:PAS domain S-box-containing protein
MFFYLTWYEYPLLFVASSALFFLFYLLGRKQARAFTYLLLILAVGSVWSMSTAFEIGINDLAVKIFFHKISQAGFIWLQVTWLFFVVQFTGHEKWFIPRNFALLAAFPLASTILAWTNEGHRIYWKSLFIIPGALSQPIGIIFGPAGWAAFWFGASLMVIATGLILQRITSLRGQPLGQAVVLLTTTVLPFMGYVADAIAPAEILSIHLLPIIFYAVATLFFIVGLLRFRLMNIIPIAYQDMIDGMRDGILVLSPENRIVHLNPTAESILRLSTRQVIGQPVTRAMSGKPDLLSNCCHGEEENFLEEITLQTSEGTDHFDLHLSTLKDRYDYPIGRLVTLHNITKRVQAENASRQNQLLLKQSEEKYRSLVENINEVIFTTDSVGVITYISPMVELHTGFSPESIIGKSFHSFVYQEDLATLEVGLGYALTGQIQVLDFRIPDQTGSLRYVRAYTHPILQDERILGLQGVLSDVTERRRVEEALERRASQLALLNYIGEQIAAVTELKNVLDNAARLIQNAFGYYHVGIFTPDFERGELLMRATSGSFAELFPEGHHLKFGQGMVGWASMHKTTLLSNDVRQEPRYTNLYPDKILTRSELAVPILVGDKMSGVLDIQSPLVNAFDDNDVRVMETVADQIAIAMENARLYEEVRRQLKDREHRENMLRIQRDLLVRLNMAKGLDETLQLAIENLAAELRASRVAISLVDWNAQILQPVVSLGYPLNRPILPTPLNRSIAGRTARSGQPMLVPNVPTEPGGLDFSPGTLSLLCAPLISNGSVIGVISLESIQANVFSHDDLRLVTILANSLAILIERGRLFEEVERARTELEKRATALEEANTSLRELDRLKSQFLANMSHELRTPLNSIIGFSEVLVDELPGALNEEQKEFTQDILDSGKHLLNLINDLLDFSKIEAGRMALEPATFEIRDLYEELRITISPMVERKSQILVFRQDGQLPALTADHLRIKQVFINLLANANKFTPERGLITVSCRQPQPDQLLFNVCDTGIGIRPEDQEMIFEEFRQVDGSMTREVSGTGLGLAISRRIVEMHQGKIWVESELGKGTSFYVCLPVDCRADLP